MKMANKTKQFKKASTIKPRVTPPSNKDNSNHKEDIGGSINNGIERYYGKVLTNKEHIKAKKLFPTPEEQTEEERVNRKNETEIKKRDDEKVESIKVKEDGKNKGKINVNEEETNNESEEEIEEEMNFENKNKETKKTR